MPTYYPDNITASRILNGSLEDQSGVDDGDVVGWDKSNPFVIAVGVGCSNKTKDPVAGTFKLRWRDVTDSGSFEDVGVSGEIKYTDTTNLVDGNTIASAIVGGGGRTYDSSQSEQSEDGNTGSKDLGTGDYTEFRFGVTAEDGDSSHQYEFELYDTQNTQTVGTCAASITMGSAGYTLTADGGSLALTGVAATFDRTYKLGAGVGNVNLVGAVVSLLKGYRLDAQAGSLFLTGTSAVLSKGRTLTTAAGSLNIAGTAASLKHNKKLNAESGSLQLSGASVNLFKGRTLDAQPGVIGLSGNSVSFYRSYVLKADPGGLLLNGVIANFLHNRVLAAGPGVLSLTGMGASLIYQAAGGGTRKKRSDIQILLGVR